MNYLQKYIINANVYLTKKKKKIFPIELKSRLHLPDFFADKINNMQLLIVNVSYLYNKKKGNS